MQNDSTTHNRSSQMTTAMTMPTEIQIAQDYAAERKIALHDAIAEIAQAEKQPYEVVCRFLETARRAVTEFRNAVKAEMQALFEAAGGCERCGGRGWIVTWDTMDSMSGCYAEFGTCTECDGTRAAVLKPYYSKYDKNRGCGGDPIRNYIKASDELTATEAALVNARTDAEEALRIIQELATPRKGKRVVVVRGRKVPKGTEGVVFWHGLDTGRWSDGGMKCGIKDDAGKKHWVKADYLKVLAQAPAPKVDAGDAVCGTEKQHGFVLALAEKAGYTSLADVFADVPKIDVYAASNGCRRTASKVIDFLKAKLDD